MTGKPGWKHLTAIFVVALAVRLLAVGWFEMKKPALLPDEEEYLQIAAVLTSENPPVFQSPLWQRLIDEAEKERKKQKVLMSMGDQSLWSESIPGAQRWIQRMPMYPLMIASVMRFTGAEDDGRAEAWVRLLQAVIGSITAVMVCAVGGRFFEGRGATWAGWMAAVYPPWVFATGLLLTETLFILLLMVCWWLGSRLAEKATTADVLMCGLVASAAILTKGSALGLFVVQAGMLVVVSRWKGRAVAAGVGLLVVIAIGISPWVARNYKVTQAENRIAEKSDLGDLVVTTCSVGRSLYEAVGPEADGGPGMERIKVPVKLAFMTEHEVDRYYYDEAMKEIRQRPGRFLKLAVVKLGRTWNVVPNYEGYRGPLMMIVAAASVIPLVVMAMWGWWRERGRWREWVLVLLPVAYFTGAHMVFVGSVRYREPVMGLLMILAGAGIAGLMARKATVGSETQSEQQATQNG